MKKVKIPRKEHYVSVENKKLSGTNFADGKRYILLIGYDTFNSDLIPYDVIDQIALHREADYANAKIHREKPDFDQESNYVVFKEIRNKMELDHWIVTGYFYRSPL